jgi:hypothetical protein
MPQAAFPGNNITFLQTTVPSIYNKDCDLNSSSKLRALRRVLLAARDDVLIKRRQPTL